MPTFVVHDIRRELIRNRRQSLPFLCIRQIRLAIPVLFGIHIIVDDTLGELAVCALCDAEPVPDDGVGEGFLAFENGGRCDDR